MIILPVYRFKKTVAVINGPFEKRQVFCFQLIPGNNKPVHLTLDVVNNGFDKQRKEFGL